MDHLHESSVQEVHSVLGLTIFSHKEVEQKYLCITATYKHT